MTHGSQGKVSCRGWGGLAGCVWLVWLVSSTVMADHRQSNPYPRVIGPTGRPYGPTQAHYQYQLRYGQRWDGNNAMYGGPEVGHVNGYPGFAAFGGWSPLPACFGGPVVIGGPVWGGPWGFQSYRSHSWSSWGFGGGFYESFSTQGGGPWFSPVVTTMVPAVGLPTQAGWPAPHVWDVLHHQQEAIQAQQELTRTLHRPDRDPLGALERPFRAPSTPEALLMSQRHQAAGDQHFQDSRLSSATDAYRSAIAAAPERPEPYFRLAVTLAARRKFSEAITVMQRLLVLDPQWPAHGTPLADMFREGDRLPIMQVKQRVADWVLEDVRDADRLFLLGVFLYFDDDRENARTLFETAALIEGQADHIAAFLRPVHPVGGVIPQQAPDRGLFGPAGLPGVAPPPIPAQLEPDAPAAGPRFRP